MNFLNYWKLEQNPFSPATPLFFARGTVEEALARIDFLVDSQRSLGVLLGPSGAGKSTLLAHYTRRASASATTRNQIIRHIVAQHSSSRELVDELVKSVSESRCSHSKFGFTSSDEPWQVLRDELVASKLYGRKLVLLVDELNEPRLQLEFVTRLLNLPFAITIVLAWDSDSREAFPASLSRYCDLRIDLPTWDLGQTADFFDFALERVHGDVAIFDAQSITRIHELAAGLPGAMRRLADLALVAGSVKRVSRITSDIVDEVQNELAFQDSDSMEAELFSTQSV